MHVTEIGKAKSGSWREMAGQSLGYFDQRLVSWGRGGEAGAAADRPREGYAHRKYNMDNIRRLSSPLVIARSHS
jgi:hypothetical protein